MTGAADAREVAGLLAGYASAEITGMARRLGFRGLTRKDEATDALAEALSDPEWCGEFVPGLSSLDLSVLRAVERQAPASPAEVLAGCAAAGAANARRALEKMLYAGFVLVGNQSSFRLDLRGVLGSSRCRLVLAPGFRGRLPAPASSSLARVLAPVPAEAIVDVRPGDPSVLLRTLRDLATVATRRALRVTSAGGVAANQVDPVCRELGLDAVGLPWDLVLDLARVGGVVSVVEGRLRPGDAAERLLLDPPDRVVGRLLGVFLQAGRWRDDQPLDPERARRSGSLREHVAGSRRIVVDVLRQVRAQGFFDVETLADLVLGLAPGVYTSPDSWEGATRLDQAPQDPYRRAVQREFVRCVLVRTLWVFGLVDVGRTRADAPVLERPPVDYQYWARFDNPRWARPRGEEPRKPAWAPEPCGYVLRLTALGRAVLWGEALAPAGTGVAACLTVGADFEVLAPVDRTPAEVLLRLASFCRAVPGHATDPVRRFRIERGAFLDAMRAGLDPEAALSGLAAASARPLPEVVTRAVRDWAGAYGAVTVYANRDLLEFASREERDRAVASRPGDEAVGERFALAKVRLRSDALVFDYASDVWAPCLDVRADGTVVLDEAKADLLVGRELENAAEPVAPPRTWRLTRASLAGSGKAADALIAWLNRRCPAGLPPGLRGLIRGACGAVPPLSVGKAEILVVPDPDLLRDLLARPEVKSAVEALLAPTVVVLQRGGRRKLEKALADLGIPTREGWQAPAAPGEAQQRPGRTTGSIPSPHRPPGGSRGNPTDGTPSGFAR